MARRPVTRAIRGWIVAPVLAVALWLVPAPATVVEQWYSRGLYTWVQPGVTSLSNLVPFAVLDLLMAGALAAVLLRVALLAMRAVTGHPIAAFTEGVRRLVRAVGLVAIAFFVLWGTNYRRLPLEAALNQPRVALTPAALEAAVVRSHAIAARMRPDDYGPQDPLSYRRLAEQLRDPMNQALRSLGRVPLDHPGVPKTSYVLTPFFTWAGVNGMVNPLALESLVHPDLVPAERGFVLAHEWAHLAGHADEAEASAVGWLACMRGDAALVYSGSLYLIMEAGGAMPRADWRRISSRFSPGVRADLEAIARRTEQQKPQVQRAATRVYDEYLKANRVPDGAASYSRALTLILGSPFKDVLK